MWKGQHITGDGAYHTISFGKDTGSGRIGDGDSTSEKKQPNLNPNTQCAGGVKTALYFIYEL